MSWILRILWFFVTQHAETKFIDHAKAQGISAYLKVMQGSRRLIVLAVICFCVLQLTIFALVGAIVCAVFLSDYDFHLKLQILLGIAGGFFLLSLLGFLALTSERVWYKASGAERMMAELLEPRQD